MAEVTNTLDQSGGVLSVWPPVQGILMLGSFRCCSPEGFAYHLHPVMFRPHQTTTITSSHSGGLFLVLCVFPP